MKSPDNQFVQSVERALSILECFTIDESELTVAEISEKLRLPKSTVVRLLSTLKSKHFIEQDQVSQKYSLGFRLFGLGNVYATRMDLRKIAYPIMMELNQKTSETVNLNIVDRGERVCIESIESPYYIRNFVKIGERNSLCFGASGKVLLAHLQEAEAGYLINSNENLNIEQKKELIKELREIREKGYSLTCGNRIEGALVISAPIFGVNGQLLAGMSISGPEERLKLKVDYLIQELLESAHHLSAKMGFNHHAVTPKQSIHG